VKMSYGMNKREIAKAKLPDVSTLYGWLEHHRSHGKPYRDAKIGEYHVFRCSCSDAFKFSDAERSDQPIRFSENKPK
jgi:hypothetical protein